MAFLLNGDTFTSPGIASATLTRSASGDDSLVITTTKFLSEEAGFGAFQQVTLTGNGDDAGANFVGWLDQAPRQIEAGKPLWQYTFVGPMRWLERSTFEQAFVFLAKDAEGLDIVGNAGATGLTVLGRSVNAETAEQGHKTLGAAITEVLAYAAADVGGFTSAVTSGLNAEVPWEPRQDDQCKNALRALLKWSPELVCRWSGTTLQIVRPAEDAKSITSAGVDLSNVRLNPRYDLLCASASIKYLRKIDGETGNERFVRSVDSSSGGEIAGGRAMKITLFLEEGEPVPAAGIAAEFMRWAGKLHLDGSFAINSLNWNNRPGDTWSPLATLGGLDAHSGVCQTVARDLFGRVETISIGVPGHLGLLDLIALKRKQRQTSAGGAAAPEEEEEGTVSVTIGAAGGGLTPGNAAWTVGNKGGSGDASVTLPPGDYRVVFEPAYDESTGKLFFAPPAPVTVTPGGAHPITSTYVPMGRLVLATAEGTMDLTSTTFNLYDAVGDGVYMGKDGWIQQKKSSKEIFSDPQAVPSSGNALVMGGTDGYAAIQVETRDDCEEEES